MAVKTYADLRTDMPVDVVGAISARDINNIIDTVESGVTSLGSRVGALETSVNTTIDGRLDALEAGGGGEVSGADFTALQGRVTTLETSVNTTLEGRLDTLEATVNTTIDGRLDTLEGQFTTLNTAINTTMDARVDALELTVSSPISAKTAGYTAVAGDDKRRITFNSATAVTFTIPASIPAGWECSILQLGVGQVTVAVLGTGASLNARGGHTKLFGQYSSGYLMVYSNAGSAPQVAFSGDTSA